MANRSVIYWLTRPAEIEEQHEHEVVLALDVGYELPNSMSASDPGQVFEQGRSHAKRMIFMSDHYRDFSNLRVLRDDHVVCYTDQPVAVERANSAPPMCRLGHLANELVEIDCVQREEAKVPIIVAEMLVECQSGLGVVGAEATQRYEPSVEQLCCSREFH